MHRTSPLIALAAALSLLFALPVAAQDAPVPDPGSEGAAGDDGDGAAAAAASRVPDAASALAAAAEHGMVVGTPAEDARPVATKAFSNVDLEVLFERGAVAPGERVRLGMFFDLDENWHVYDMHNPGDIGLPTEVTLAVPDGFASTPWRTHAPELYREKSGDTSYVHHDVFAAVTEVIVPSDAPLGVVHIEATYDFQFCYDRCIRKYGSLKIPLEIVASNDGVATYSERFDAVEPGLYSFDTERVEGAISHEPLSVTQSGLVVVEVDAGVPVTRDSETHPVVVFDQVDGVEVEMLEVIDLAEGKIRAIGRISVEESHAPEEPVTALGATVQLGVGDGEFAAFRLEVPVVFEPAATESSALESPLLADLDVDGYLGEEATAAPKPPPTEQLPIWQALLFAILGGIILNIMPCVLPVLSLKALALVEEATESQRKVQSFVAMYVLGVLASFWALAAVVISIKLSGELVGWGFQFQEPGYVLVMSGAIFAFALSLFGVFEIPGLTVGAGSSSGLKGSFMHGVLTTALSTPCSAPLLGSALTFALAQSPMMILITFSLIGVGLAAPVSVLTLVPAARRFIPRPGPWMETFKHVIAFMLVGTVIWLLGVLTAQVDSDSMMSVYILFGLISLAAWMIGRWTGPLVPTARKIAALSAAALLMVFGARQIELEYDAAADEASLATDLIEWKAFKGEESLALANDGKTLFIDFTADWCATCKTMEATAIETDAVASLIRDNGIVALKADLTRKNPELSKWVEYYGRSAIPLYVVVPANKPDAPVILPEVITESMLLEALRAAGPSDG